MLDKKVIDVFGMQKQPETGRFGVEVEMEGEQLPDKIPGWALKEEHSLRGESREFATDRAVSMQELKDRLFAMAKVLGKYNSKVNTSYRGSTHIHYNVQNETFRTVMNEWVIFTAIEPVFLGIIGGNRNGNLFCMPSYDTGDTLNAFYNQLSMIVRDRQKWPDRGKYAARNADPVRRFGSVEYRFFPPETGDPIITWCQYLDKLWGLARLYTDAGGLHKAVQAYREDPSVFLSIFPDEVLPPKHIVTEMSRVGAELAYELSRKYVLLTKVGQKSEVDEENIIREEPQDLDPFGWRGRDVDGLPEPGPALAQPNFREFVMQQMPRVRRAPR